MCPVLGETEGRPAAQSVTSEARPETPVGSRQVRRGAVTRDSQAVCRPRCRSVTTQGSQEGLGGAAGKILVADCISDQVLRPVSRSGIIGSKGHSHVVGPCYKATLLHRYKLQWCMNARLTVPPSCLVIFFWGLLI